MRLVCDLLQNALINYCVVRNVDTLCYLTLHNDFCYSVCKGIHKMVCEPCVVPGMYGIYSDLHALDLFIDLHNTTCTTHVYLLSKTL